MIDATPPWGIFPHPLFSPNPLQPPTHKKPNGAESCRQGKRKKMPVLMSRRLGQTKFPHQRKTLCPRKCTSVRSVFNFSPFFSGKLSFVFLFSQGCDFAKATKKRELFLSAMLYDVAEWTKAREKGKKRERKRHFDGRSYSTKLSLPLFHCAVSKDADVINSKAEFRRENTLQIGTGEVERTCFPTSSVLLFFKLRHK